MPPVVHLALDVKVKGYVHDFSVIETSCDREDGRTDMHGSGR